jgi:SAM-dependent methyltransferase
VLPDPAETGRLEDRAQIVTTGSLGCAGGTFADGLRIEAASSVASARDIVTTLSYDRDFGEQLWSRTLRERADDVVRRPPNAHLTAEATGLRRGLALDAECGHGSDTLWRAARGWQVTAIDFSTAALAHARSMAEAAGADIAGRVDWVEAHLASWTPQSGHYDLVACLYVHVTGSAEEVVRRMGAAVAPSGTLLLVGHRPFDPDTGAATPAAGQVQVSVEAAIAARDHNHWGSTSPKAPGPRAPASTP